MGVKIFISYALEDSKSFKISKIVKDLKFYSEIGEVLFCKESEEPSFIDFIEKAINICDILLLFCSPNAKNSYWVKLEWQTALTLQKKIITIFIDEDDIPNILRTYDRVEFNKNNYNLTIKEIHRLILKNKGIRSNKLMLFEDKLVKSSEIQILKDLEKEIKHSVENFEVYRDGSITFLDLSSINLKAVPESIFSFPDLMEVSFSEYSFETDEDMRKLISNGVLVKMGGIDYKDGYIEFRIKKDIELKQINEKNADIVNSAQKYFCSEDWDKSIELFNRSKDICIQQGWLSRFKYVERMILKAEKEKNKEIENKRSGFEAKIKVLNLIPQSEANIIQNLERYLNKQFMLVDDIRENTRLAFIVRNLHITAISFYNCELLNFPKAITELKYLQYINLSYNMLTKLPESIADLTSLKELFLSRNRLRTLPESLFKLKSLNTLNISKNQLEKLPESIDELKSLKYLNLQRNFLSSVPNSIGNLSSLQTLYLNFNKILTLPESIGKLSSLKTIYLNYNNLATLPDSICELTSLEYLNLRGNFLSTLPDRLANLLKLKTIVLNSNYKFGQDV